MQAYELIIDAKVKTSPFAIVSVDDFQVHAGQPLNPQIILAQPNISLYCLDHANQQAIFIETAPDANLLQAPFYFIAQYEAAQRLIAVPYQTLHALASQVTIAPQRIILFYSTGRCGSTLFSHVMNLNTAVISFAEPDVFSQLVQLRTAKQASTEALSTLLWDVIMVMSANAQLQGFDYYAFKFRSYVLSSSDLLYRALPEAKLLFMYRHALTWARSFSRAFGAPTDAALKTNLETHGFRYMIPSVNAYLQTNGYPISWVDHVAHMWVSTMHDARWLQQQGAALATARFADMRTTSEPICEALLTHCGLPMPKPSQLAAVLGKDSQAGTEGAQDKKEPARRLTNADLVILENAIRQLDPTLAPDTML